MEVSGQVRAPGLDVAPSAPARIRTPIILPSIPQSIGIPTALPRFQYLAHLPFPILKSPEGWQTTSPSGIPLVRGSWTLERNARGPELWWTLPGPVGPWFGLHWFVRLASANLSTSETFNSRRQGTGCDSHPGCNILKSKLFRKYVNTFLGSST
jgi:hypothetical protein